MRLRPVLAAAAAAALLPVVLAPAASAYDREAYEYAAGHMIARTDIPKALGAFDTRLNFGANPGFNTFLCYLPSSDPNANGTDVKIGKSKYQFSANYSAKKDNGPSVGVQVLQYANSTEAIKGFNALKTQSKKCNGAGSTTWTDDDGTEYTNSWNVSTSNVPGVSVVGVDSIGITQDNLSTNSTSEDKFLNDNYTVYSLVNDVIIQTSYYANGPQNLTTAQRKAVNQLAFNAVGVWVG